MSDITDQEQGVEAISQKLSEIDDRLNIMNESIKDLNGAVDMLVRFSMTAKAFMELSISQGIVDPYELNRIASTYEKAYSANLDTTPESSKDAFNSKAFTK